MRQFLLAFLALIALAAPAAAEPVLMISIDGLRPGDVIEAEARGLKLPNLRRFVSEGTYASGVVGVLPTVTYPSHTTLITGTSGSGTVCRIARTSSRVSMACSTSGRRGARGRRSAWWPAGGRAPRHGSHAGHRAASRRRPER